jgi:GNAT superfamily N-acetyltransferase
MSPSDFVIKCASNEQIDALVSLMQELGYSTSRRTIETQLVRYADSEESAVLVASSSTEVFGIINGHLIPALHQSGNIGRITALVVGGKSRSKGVASELLQELEQWFRANDCLRFEVTSADHREVAHRFYESNDYEFGERRFLKTP